MYLYAAALFYRIILYAHFRTNIVEINRIPFKRVYGNNTVNVRQNYPGDIRGYSESNLLFDAA